MFKKLKNKTLILHIVFFAVIIALVIASMSFLWEITVFNQHRNNVPVGEIYGARRFGQTFIASYNNLSAIKLLLATYNRKNKGPFIFYLKYQVNDKRDLYHYQGEMSRIKDNKYFCFRFPPIKNSKGKQFYFYIESPTARPGNAITIWSNSEELYQDGQKFINGLPAEGDLTFKTVYDSGLWKNFTIFLEKITKNKPFPLNKKVFYMVLIFLFLFVGPNFLSQCLKYFLKTDDTG